MFIELYRNFLNYINLGYTNLFKEVILYGGACLCLLLDAVLTIIIIFIIISIYIKLRTKKNIWYWLNLLVDRL